MENERVGRLLCIIDELTSIISSVRKINLPILSVKGEESCRDYINRLFAILDSLMKEREDLLTKVRERFVFILKKDKFNTPINTINDISKMLSDYKILDEIFCDEDIYSLGCYHKDLNSQNLLNCLKEDKIRDVRVWIKYVVFEIEALSRERACIMRMMSEK